MRRLQSSNEPSETPRRFALTGCVTAAVYCLLVVVYHFGAESLAHFSREFIAWFVVLSLMALYGYGWRLARTSPAISLRLVVTFGLMFGLVCVAIAPFHSTDLYSYINRGWEQTHYHLNPYVRTVSSIPNWERDRMFATAWVDNPCPYGFLFALIARSLAWLGNGNPLVTSFLFKTLDLACFAGIGWLLFAAGKELRLDRLDLPLYLFLWNPLVLLHEIANGHNDLLVALFLMIAIYFIVTERMVFVIPALICGALIKPPLAITVPFALVLVLRSADIRETLTSLGLALIAIAATAAPYIADLRNFPLAVMADNLLSTTGSLKSVFDDLLKAIAETLPALHLPIPNLSAAFGAVIWLSFAGFFFLQLIRFAENNGYLVKRFLAVTVLMQFVLIAVASSKTYPWYINMFLPAALLLRLPNWLTRLVVVVSCTELLGFTFLGQAHFLNYLDLIALPTILVAALNWPAVYAAIVGKWSRSLEEHEPLSERTIAAVA